MSTPVDVLSLLDDVAAIMVDNRGRYTAERLIKARAAIAELIEASSRLADSLTDGSDSRQHHLYVRAALARVRGAA